MTKLCIDCKHCTVESAEAAKTETPMCIQGGRSPVDGSYIASCGNQRGGWPATTSAGLKAWTCGPDAEWFEPRSKAGGSPATP